MKNSPTRGIPIKELDVFLPGDGMFYHLPKWLSMKELCQFLRCRNWDVRRWVDEGKLPQPHWDGVADCWLTDQIRHAILRDPYRDQ
jgi:hypothetical protein